MQVSPPARAVVYLAGSPLPHAMPWPPPLHCACSACRAGDSLMPQHSRFLPAPASHMCTGAVAYLKDVRNAISAARLVMEHTQHTILAGGAATRFAQQMGLPLQTLNTERSMQAWQQRCAAVARWRGKAAG